MTKDDWQLIETAPTDNRLILVGFGGQYDWYFYVAPAKGIRTGVNMPFAGPTHWVAIVNPDGKLSESPK